MDILFFAAVAVFIFLKLRKQLGQIDEEEKKRIEENVAKRRAEILAMQSQVQQAGSGMKVVNPVKQVALGQIGYEASPTEEKILSKLDESTKQGFVKILESSKISAEFFVNGAKSAFEIILKAFAESDLETLKMLLSEKIYKGFEEAINQRKARSESLVTNVISIEKTEIVSAILLGNIASIVVHFVSKQINYITDASGKIVKGKKDEIHEIVDSWTFTRDLTSSSPNWVVNVMGK